MFECYSKSKRITANGWYHSATTLLPLWLPPRAEDRGKFQMIWSLLFVAYPCFSPDSLPLAVLWSAALSLSLSLWSSLTVCLSSPRRSSKTFGLCVERGLTLALTETCQLHASKRCCFWEDAIDRHVTEEIVCVHSQKHTWPFST